MVLPQESITCQRPSAHVHRGLFNWKLAIAHVHQRLTESEAFDLKPTKAEKSEISKNTVMFPKPIDLDAGTTNTYNTYPINTILAS